VGRLICDHLVVVHVPSWSTAAFCQPGLEQTYGLQVGPFVSLDAGGPLTKQALRAGEISLGMVFTTDGELTQAERPAHSRRGCAASVATCSSSEASWRWIAAMSSGVAFRSP
jgi:hypothetical protein